MTTATRLSPRQARMLDFIRQFITEHSWAPSIRELMDECDITSTSVARYNLNAMERLGVIELGRNEHGLMQARCIRLTYKARKE